MRKEPVWHIPASLVLAFIVTALLVVGCAGADLDREPASTEDSVLAVSVKAALIRSLESNAASIDVETHNGSVRLRGFAENDAQ